MTTTAHEDQFTVEPEPVRQTYSTADILRRNVEDLELALRKQAERAEAAEAELLAVREDNHSMMGEILSLRERTEIAESELEKLRQQAASSVPEEWRNIVTKMLGWWDAPVMTMSQGKFIAEKARALLQSAGGDK